MVKVGEIYRHEQYGVLVEIRDITPTHFIVYLGLSNSKYGRIILFQDRVNFIKTFNKLSSLEMELL